jgi:hypothetical protein
MGKAMARPWQVLLRLQEAPESSRRLHKGLIRPLKVLGISGEYREFLEGAFWPFLALCGLLGLRLGLP